MGTRNATSKGHGRVEQWLGSGPAGSGMWWILADVYQWSVHATQAPGSSSPGSTEALVFTSGLRGFSLPLQDMIVHW